MLHRHISVSESYSVLGLTEDTTLEVVKSTYKQLALKTHPDKNLGNAEATAQFQRVSEAYSVLLNHLDPDPAPSPGQRQRPYYTYAANEYDYDSPEADYFNDDDRYGYSNGYGSDDEFAERMDFYMFLLNEALRGRTRRFRRSRFYQPCDCPRCSQQEKEPEPRESSQEYAARIRRVREEQEAAEERRKHQEAIKKADQENQRERERQAAEERQKVKASKKKAQAEAIRKAADDKTRARQQHVQTQRSAVFAAAYKGDIEAVKKGVWEDDVDAAGGEVKSGCDAFVKAMPEDRRKTLSHIAASNNNVTLVDWLDSHGADMEERDSRGYTPFHVALGGGHLQVAKFIMEAHPPEDAAGVYESPSNCSLLDIAMNSCVPAGVWLILENNIASQAEMQAAWAKLTSPSGRQAFIDTSGSPGKYEEIVNLFRAFGKFSAVTEEDEPEDSSTDGSSSTGPSQRVMPYLSEDGHQPRFGDGALRGRGRGGGRDYGRGSGRGRARGGFQR